MTQSALSARFKCLLSTGTLLIGVLLCLSSAKAEGTQIASTNDTVATSDARHIVPGGMTLQAVGTESGSYNSNPLLLTTKPKALWGSITAPELIFNDKTPTTSITSDTTIDSNNFNQSKFDSNDVHSKLDIQNMTQRWTTRLQGNLDYDTTRTSELSSYNNITETPVRHLGASLTPQITYNYLPTDKIGLSGSYASNTYDNSTFTNYEVFSATPSYAHDFDPLNTGTVSVVVERYRATSGLSSTTDSVGPSVGWQTTLTPQLSGQFSVGYLETRQQAANSQSKSWTPQISFSGNLAYKADNDKLTAAASRSELPFGNGTEALVTQVSANDVHDINDLFAVNLGVSYQLEDYPVSATGDLDSLASATTGLTYHVTQEVDLVASYQYRYETLVNIPASAQSNTGLLSIVFRPDEWTL